MTVINPNSISGITSITLPSGDGNVLTIHTNDGTERFRIDSSGNVKVGSAATISPDGDLFVTGVTTATTFTGAHSGSGANLTSLPAAQLTGSLPAISGANLTGIAATDNVRTGILDVAGIATFRNDVKIGTAVTISESGIEASGIGITCANINGTQIGGRRNIIINGAMTIQQRMTPNTSGGQNASGMKTVDRFELEFSGTDNSPTQIPVDVASGTTPYTLGFRRAFKAINGNQTSGAGASDRIVMIYRTEAQDMANCGWNYLSDSSYITFSYWVKSSVAQNFYNRFKSADSTSQAYVTETGSLTADTWTKITKTIPGNSNIVFNNDNGEGLEITWEIFRGTDATGTRPLNAWAAADGTTRTPDQTSTWYTTDDATFEITGVQLEVGSQATPFEHRNHADELMNCFRYYQRVCLGSDAAENNACPIISGAMYGSLFYGVYHLKNEMRTAPTMEAVNATDYYLVYRGGSYDACDEISVNNLSKYQCTIRVHNNLSGTSGDAGWARTNNAAAFAAFTAEL